METRASSVWRPGKNKFALEPRFVARPGGEAEDDGWLLTVMFDSGAPLAVPAAAAPWPSRMSCSCQCQRSWSPTHPSPSGATPCAVLPADTQVCQLVVLDAADLEKGPVAVLQFAKPVPSGLHGCWSDTYYGPEAA
jgi:all-trans-8'-apo-beta-carotenal 15,15'-oxygenase